MCTVFVPGFRLNILSMLNCQLSETQRHRRIAEVSRKNFALEEQYSIHCYPFLVVSANSLIPLSGRSTVHCKKRFTVFPSPAGMQLTKPFLAGNNLIIPVLGEFGKEKNRLLPF